MKHSLSPPSSSRVIQKLLAQSLTVMAGPRLSRLFDLAEQLLALSSENLAGIKLSLYACCCWQSWLCCFCATLCSRVGQSCGSIPCSAVAPCIVIQALCCCFITCLRVLCSPACLILLGSRLVGECSWMRQCSSDAYELIVSL